MGLAASNTADQQKACAASRIEFFNEPGRHHVGGGNGTISSRKIGCEARKFAMLITFRYASCSQQALGAGAQLAIAARNSANGGTGNRFPSRAFAQRTN